MPILRTSYRGEDYLVALAGQAHWVKNVRAAHGQAVIRRLGSRPVHLEELAVEDRDPSSPSTCAPGADAAARSGTD